MDDAVNMREVHRFIADSVLLSDRFEAAVQRIAARKLEPTGRKIAVAGAGPAGLTAAFYLALLGHDVTVFDPLPEAGGMLRFALPEYRLPKPVLRREIELIERLGVKFVLNTRVGADIPLNELDERFDAVFLAIGTWKESWVYLPGTELKGVYPALPLLESIAKGEPVNLGRKVVVIGGGNAAIDSARTSLRMGAEVTVVYRRERKDMPAIEEETAAAEEEGARIVFLSAPHRIIGDAKGNVKALEVVKTRLGEYDTLRPPQAGADRRSAAHRMRLGDSGGRRNRGPGLRQGIRPADQGKRHHRGQPLHAGDQPSALLCRRRPGDRRFQRFQCHGLRQAGGARHRRATDGCQALGRAVPAHGVRADAAQGRRAKAADITRAALAGPRSACSRSTKWWLGLSAEETHEECLPLPAL